jgi:glycosyltransferase involved in cell wall biosynthesis
MSSTTTSWVCCQLGAREHYVVPRALHRAGRLAALITDAWVTPSSGWQMLPGEQAQRLGDRYHPELAAARVHHFTASLVGRELVWRAQGVSGWDLFMARNSWFQHHALRKRLDLPPLERPILFAHSYVALELFRWAKPHDWRLVLGQIDPGEHHFDVVRDAALASPRYGAAPAAPPPEYFSRWREECDLADRIVVNSEWSKQSLAAAGVALDKLTVVPLVYEPEDAADRAAFERSYPRVFDGTRPLRLLFVGQVAVAKGAAALLEAIDQVSDLPVHLTMVGGRTMEVPREYLAHPAITWVDHLPRHEVMRHYREADALIFPSLSDGFGMAQIEARGWGLPIVASRNCGRVVNDGVDGVLLPEVSANAIAVAIRTLVARPATLAAFSQASRTHAATGLDALGRALTEIEAA